MRAIEFLPILSSVLIDSNQLDDSLYTVFEYILTDDVNTDDVIFLKKGFKRDIDPPIIGNEYLPLLVVCLNNMSVAISSKKRFTKIIDIKNDIIFFDDGQEIQREREHKVMYSKLFLFDNERDRNNVLTILMTRFDNVDYNITENKKYE